ncbi:MAG: hypothetical protein ACTSPM_04720 [Candidatus Heimdallarchaeota archaeon]
MTVVNLSESKDDSKKVQKEIETGIINAISDISNEDDWPEGADAYDVQLIITQLARSAAHLRDTRRIENEKNYLKENYPHR